MARKCASASSQYLRVASVPVSAPPLTLAAWFKAADVTQNHTPVAILKENVSNHGFYIAFSGNVANDPFQAISVEASTFRIASATLNPGFTAGTWAHGCGVFTSTTSRDAYVNGGNKGSDTNSSNPAGLIAVNVGRYRSSTDTFSNGTIAHVGIWKAALSLPEIQALAAGVLPLRIRPESLVAYWPLWGDDSPELDLHPRSTDANNYPLTLTNTPTKDLNSAPTAMFTPRPLIVPMIEVAASGGMTARSINLGNFGLQLQGAA